MKWYSFNYLLFLCLTMFACKSERIQNNQELQSFQQFSKNFIEERWKINPISATYNGYKAYDDQLPIPNEERKKTVIAWAQNQLDNLHKIDKNNLSDLELVDYALIENELESTIWYAEEFQSGQWNPSSYNLGGVFFYTLKGDLPLEERLENANKRLAIVPEYYEQAAKNITQPTRQHLDLAIEQIPYSKSTIESLRDSLAFVDMPEAFQTTLENNIHQANQAIDDYVSVLKEYKDGSNEFKNFRLGSELYDKKFELDINAGLSAKENYEAALAAKDEVHQKMLELAEQLWPKYFPNKVKPDGLTAVQQLIDTISNSHTTKENFVAEVKRQVPELIEFINENELLYLDPTKPLIIRETPKYMRGVAGASVSAPGPYDKDAETYYNVTPIDDWTDEQAESYLREYNDYMLQILNIHEAVPGHYAQLVYANKSPSLVKSILGNGAMIEGWACFSERVMLENGYGDGPTKDELMLMYYKWNLRIIANSILDYEIHNKGMTEQEALALLKDEAFQEEAEATGKWKRATVSSVQLTSYFNGLTEIQNLKDDIAAQKGADFSIKEFNEQFLSYGSAPVRLIRQLMLEEKE